MTFTPIIYNFDCIHCQNIISIAHAEVKIFTEYGRARFDFGESDPYIIKKAQIVARSRAEQKAKDRAGIYIKSQSKTINTQISEDSIFTMTNTIVDVVDVKYKSLPIEMDDDIGIRYEATVTVKVDTSRIANYLKIDPKKRQTIEMQNKELQKSIFNNDKKFDNIEKSVINAKTVIAKNKLKSEFDKAYNELLANQKLEEGNRLYFQGNDIAAMKFYNEAIQINPNMELAYFFRGINYLYLNKDNFDNSTTLNNYNKALNDFNKTLEINSNFALVYVFRAVIHMELNDIKQALNDINKAIQLEPNVAYFYYVRNTIYQFIGDEKKAQADYVKFKNLGGFH